MPNNISQIVGAIVITIIGVVFHFLQEDNPLAMLSTISEVLNQWNNWLAKATGFSSKTIVGVEVATLLGLGALMIALAQYAVAVGAWVAVGFIIVSKAFQWPGVINRRLLTIILRTLWALGGFVFSVFLITATNLNRDDKPWFPLHKTPKTVVVEPVAIYLECEWAAYPITIPADTTIHLLRLYPNWLVAHPLNPTVGIFYDLPAPTNAPRVWPNKSEGRWPTKDESIANAKAAVLANIPGGIPAPFLFKCSLSSYGKETVEDVSISMQVSNFANKSMVYQIPFDPLASGTKFSFSVVNMCPTPVLVNWPDTTTVHVLGESDKRKVPLKIIKRDWPGNFMVFYPSEFKWAGIDKCDWGW